MTEHSEPPNNVIRPDCFKGAPRPVVAPPLSPEEVKGAGAISFSDARMRKAAGAVINDAWRGKDGYVLLFEDGAQLHLDAEELSKPLKEIKEVSDHLKKNGSERVQVVRVRMDGRLMHQEARIFTKEMMGESIAETFAKEKLFPELGEKTLGKRIKEMTPVEKGWTAANVAMAALFLYSAVDNFRHSVERDPLNPEAKPHVHLSQMMWGAVNTALAGLSVMQVTTALRGGR